MLGEETLVTVYRKDTSRGTNFKDVSYSDTKAPFYGEVQPVSGTSTLKNGQVLQNVNELIYVDGLSIDVKDGDELVFDGVFRRVLFASYHKLGLIPHVEIYTTTSQWIR